MNPGSIGPGLAATKSTDPSTGQRSSRPSILDLSKLLNASDVAQLGVLKLGPALRVAQAHQPGKPRETKADFPADSAPTADDTKRRSTSVGNTTAQPQAREPKLLALAGGAQRIPCATTSDTAPKPGNGVAKAGLNLSLLGDGPLRTGARRVAVVPTDSGKTQQPAKPAGSVISAAGRASVGEAATTAATTAAGGGGGGGGGAAAEPGEELLVFRPPVKPLVVASDQQLEAEVETIAGQLRDCVSTDWQLRIESMRKLAGLVLGGAAELETFWPCMRTLREPLSQQVLDLRSAVVREACTLLCFLARQLRGAFEELADHFIPVLFKLNCVTINVISSSGDECIRKLIEYTRINKAVGRIAEAAQNTNPTLRARCTAYTQLLLEVEERDYLERFVDTLESLVRSKLADKNDEVRGLARRACLAFAHHWPARATALLSGLDAKTQRLVEEERKVYRPAARQPGQQRGPAVPRRKSVSSVAVSRGRAEVKEARLALPTAPAAAPSASEFQQHKSSTQPLDSQAGLPSLAASSPAKLRGAGHHRSQSAPEMDSADPVLQRMTSLVQGGGGGGEAGLRVQTHRGNTAVADRPAAEPSPTSAPAVISLRTLPALEQQPQQQPQQVAAAVAARGRMSVLGLAQLAQLTQFAAAGDATSTRSLGAAKRVAAPPPQQQQQQPQPAERATGGATRVPAKAAPAERNPPKPAAKPPVEHVPSSAAPADTSLQLSPDLSFETELAGDSRFLAQPQPQPQQQTQPGSRSLMSLGPVQDERFNDELEAVEVEDPAEFDPLADSHTVSVGVPRFSRAAASRRKSLSALDALPAEPNQKQQQQKNTQQRRASLSRRKSLGAGQAAAVAVAARNTNNSASSRRKSLDPNTKLISPLSKPRLQRKKTLDTAAPAGAAGAVPATGPTAPSLPRAASSVGSASLAALLELGRHQEWEPRLRCCTGLQEVFSGQRPGEVLVYLERITSLLVERLQDGHHKVQQAAVPALGALLFCTQCQEADLKGPLERLLPGLLLLLSNKREATRTAANVVMDRLAREYSVDTLLPVVLRVLDHPSLRVRQAGLEVAVFLIDQAPDTFDLPAHMKSIVAKTHSLLGYKTPKLAEKAGELYRHLHHRAQDALFTQLLALEPQRARRVRECLATRLPDLDKLLTLFAKQRGDEPAKRPTTAASASTKRQSLGGPLLHELATGGGGSSKGQQDSRRRQSMIPLSRPKSQQQQGPSVATSSLAVRSQQQQHQQKQQQKPGQARKGQKAPSAATAAAANTNRRQTLGPRVRVSLERKEEVALDLELQENIEAVEQIQPQQQHLQQEEQEEQEAAAVGQREEAEERQPESALLGPQPSEEPLPVVSVVREPDPVVAVAAVPAFIETAPAPPSRPRTPVLPFQQPQPQAAAPAAVRPNSGGIAGLALLSEAAAGPTVEVRMPLPGFPGDRKSPVARPRTPLLPAVASLPTPLLQPYNPNTFIIPPPVSAADALAKPFSRGLLAPALPPPPDINALMAACLSPEAQNQTKAQTVQQLGSVLAQQSPVVWADYFDRIVLCLLDVLSDKAPDVRDATLGALSTAIESQKQRFANYQFSEALLVSLLQVCKDGKTVDTVGRMLNTLTYVLTWTQVSGVALNCLAGKHEDPHAVQTALKFVAQKITSATPEEVSKSLPVLIQAISQHLSSAHPGTRMSCITAAVALHRLLGDTVLDQLDQLGPDKTRLIRLVLRKNVPIPGGPATATTALAAVPSIGGSS